MFMTVMWRTTGSRVCREYRNLVKLLFAQACRRMFLLSVTKASHIRLKHQPLLLQTSNWSSTASKLLSSNVNYWWVWINCTFVFDYLKCTFTALSISYHRFLRSYSRCSPRLRYFQPLLGWPTDNDPPSRWQVSQKGLSMTRIAP